MKSRSTQHHTRVSKGPIPYVSLRMTDNFCYVYADYAFMSASRHLNIQISLFYTNWKNVLSSNILNFFTQITHSVQTAFGSAA